MPYRYFHQSYEVDDKIKGDRMWAMVLCTEHPGKLASNVICLIFNQI